MKHQRENPSQTPQSTPKIGFRCSLLDAGFLVVSAIAMKWLRRADFVLWWIVPMVAGHFFLFCNVFLVWRRLELLWAGTFIINAGAHFAYGHTDVWRTLIWQLPMTALVIIWQMRSPWYRGIFAIWINRTLSEVSADEAS